MYSRNQRSAAEDPAALGARDESPAEGMEPPPGNAAALLLFLETKELVQGSSLLEETGEDDIYPHRTNIDLSCKIEVKEHVTNSFNITHINCSLPSLKDLRLKSQQSKLLLKVLFHV